MIFEFLVSIFFIIGGLYTAINYKKANKEALSESKMLNKLILRKDLKIGKKTTVFNEYFTLIMSVVFILIGLYTLSYILLNANPIK